MAALEVMAPWSARIPDALYRQLAAHLFPGDGRPHGAAVLAGVAERGSRKRLLIREIIPAIDGIDYVPGTDGRGHHKLTSEFVRDAALRAGSQRLAYLAVHAHDGTDRVAFSRDDMRSHERGYPALRGLLEGRPAGALVFAERAVAGDLWLAGDQRAILGELVVVGASQVILRPQPLVGATGDPIYDRQARLFGDAGQHLLGDLKVAVIGVGGVGMLLVEYLARLGVGHLVVIDPDRVEKTNLPRLPGARRTDARMLFQSERWPSRLRELGRRTAARKVNVARRLAREANRTVHVERIFADVRDPETAARVLDCDYMFLAANTDQARLLFNAMVHQYLIPGVQLGAKVQVRPDDGRVLAVHSVVRPVIPGRGCLWCNEVISPTRLADESTAPTQRRAQRYVDDPEVPAPSVITLNATAAAVAANDFLFTVTGLTAPEATLDYLRFQPIDRDAVFDEPRVDVDCPECSATGRLGRGESGRRLPTFYH